MPNEGRELPTERIGVLFAQVDLILRGTEPEPHRLIRRASIRNLWTASPPSVYREVQRAERVARQLACKTFDQMAGELKA